MAETTSIVAPSSKYTYFELNTTGDINSGYGSSHTGSIYVGTGTSSANNAGRYCSTFGILLYDLPNRANVNLINSIQFSITTRTSSSGYNGCVARIEYVGTAYNSETAYWRVGASTEQATLDEGITNTYITSDTTTCANFAQLIGNAVSGQYYYFRLVREAGQGATANADLTLTINYEVGNRRAAAFYVMSSGQGSLITQPPAGMTSANSQGCVVSASSEYSSDYPAWRAFDNNLSTRCWASANASGHNKWIQLKMTQALYSIQVKITNRTDHTTVNGLISGEIYGSNDNFSTYEQIGSITGRDGTTQGAETTHTCTNNTTAYQYVRIVETDRANPSGYLAIGQIKITGYPYPTGNHWKPAIAYVYENGAWKELAPYTYI